MYLLSIRQHTRGCLKVQVVLGGNFGAGIPDNRVSLNAGFDRHPSSSVSLPRGLVLCFSPAPYNDSQPPPPLLSLSFSFDTRHVSFSFVHFLRADRDSALRLFDVRSLPGGRRLRTIRVYAITPGTSGRKTPGLPNFRSRFLLSPVMKHRNRQRGIFRPRAKLISRFFSFSTLKVVERTEREHCRPDGGE